jgi:F420-non-reducing hydrogenase iron-sulfur subunit
MMQDFGIEEPRFRLEWVSASEAPRFAQVITAMVSEVKALGPSAFG